MRVKAKAILGLDAVLVDNSQSSKGFKSVREVLSAPNVQYITLHDSGVRTGALQTYTMLEASQLFVLLRVSCSPAARFWSFWIIDRVAGLLTLINGALG